jgi:small-conductance mechanosensitive channel
MNWSLPVLPAPAALNDLLAALTRPSAVTELAVAAAMLLSAWLLVRLMGGRHRSGPSVWFGDHVVDGVLFPVLALVLAMAARHVLQALGEPLAVFRVVIPVLVSLALVRLAARVLSAAFPGHHWVVVVERSVSWLVWGGVVLWVTGLMPAVLAEMDGVRWKLGSSSISLRNLVEGGITAAVVMMLALWVSAALERKLLMGPVENLSLRKIAANLLRVALLFVGLVIAMSAVGIDLTALSVFGGAIGVGLGFGLQKLAANYVSGFVILAEGSLRIGDTVKVDGFEGRITDITTRYTIVRAINGRESIVPNEMLITQRVENASLADSRVLVSTVVQVAYGTDLAVLMPALAAVVQQVPRVVTEPAVAVHLSNFAADGLELSLHFWITDPQNGTGGVRSDVNLAIWTELQTRRIEVPFPQRVLHQVSEPAQAQHGADAA